MFLYRRGSKTLSTSTSTRWSPSVAPPSTGGGALPFTHLSSCDITQHLVPGVSIITTQKGQNLNSYTVGGGVGGFRVKGIPGSKEQQAEHDLEEKQQLPGPDT